MNKLLEEFKDLEKKCESNLSSKSEEYNKQIEGINIEIQRAIDNLIIQVAEQRKIDEKTSSSCLSTLVTFMDKTEVFTYICMR